MRLKKVSDFVWEIGVGDGMNVPGRVFASERLIEDIKKDKCLEQVRNVAKLPGIIGASLAMPDAHFGYGFCIGGVAAFDLDKGVVCPGGVGYDINCSVRLLRTNLSSEDLERVGRKKIIHSLFRAVPSGVGRGSKFDLRSNRRSQVAGRRLRYEELDEVLVGGARWAVEKGFGVEEDLLHIEDNGCIEGVDVRDVSERAKSRGFSQLGSLGAGNHFLEIQVVDEIFDEKVARVFGLEKGMVTIMIHCGSRGLGHQVASDYIRLMSNSGYGFSGSGGMGEIDRELVNAPIKSELGKKYLSAMGCAANFAFANKQLITHWIREDLKNYFPDVKIDTVYEVCHNIAKIEDFSNVGIRGVGVSGSGEVLVMRKGATRSFGPGRIEIPLDYRKVGQPVLIPGSMGTASYVLVGTKKAEEISFGSTAHGAGRVMSRSEAWKRFDEKGVSGDLKKIGVEFEAGSKKGIVEEAPGVYKDIDEVVRVSDELGIGKLVARLRPVGVVKG